MRRSLGKDAASISDNSVIDRIDTRKLNISDVMGGDGGGSELSGSAYGGRFGMDLKLAPS